MKSLAEIIKSIDKKDLADTHSCGMDVYVSKKTGELVVLPREQHFGYGDFEDENTLLLDKIEKDKNNWIRFEAPDTRESFEIMSSFVYSLEHSQLRERLLYAIENKKPFSKFNNIIHNCDLREDWFAFRQIKLKKRVKRELKYLKQDLED